VKIGLVMLMGLSAKNPILIVEFAKLALERGNPLLDAALEGAVILAKTKLKNGRCGWTEQRAERTHSRFRQARREAARTGSERSRRGACVGLAERSERSQPHARAGAA